VPQEFPISLASILSPFTPMLGESCGTTPVSFHTNTSNSVPYLYPHHLPFGDTLPPTKADSTFRVAFCNIGGFPALGQNNPKVSELKTFITSHDIDLFRGCESNLNWHSLPNHIQLKEWFQTVDGCRTFSAHNSNQKFGKYQYGGTFWVTNGPASTHIATS